jgi:hypothetical protein
MKFKFCEIKFRYLTDQILEGCHSISTHCPPPTVYYPLFTALSTVHCSLFFFNIHTLPGHCLLPTAHCPLSTVYYPLPNAHCLLSTIYCPLLTGHCILTVLCSLSTAHCPLLTPNCPLPTVHCACRIFAASLVLLAF